MKWLIAKRLAAAALVAALVVIPVTGKQRDALCAAIALLAEPPAECKR